MFCTRWVLKELKLRFCNLICPQNIPYILVTLLVSKLDRSRLTKLAVLSFINIWLILFTELVLRPLRLIRSSESKSLKAASIYTTFSIANVERFNSLREEQLWNILTILIAFFAEKLDKLIDSSFTRLAKSALKSVTKSSCQPDISISLRAVWL